MTPRCLVLWKSDYDLARDKDVFGIMPTGFGKSLIFQLFPCLAKAALTLENSMTIVVWPEKGKTRRKREKEKANQHVIIHTDNEAAIHIINKGTTSIPLLSVI